MLNVAREGPPRDKPETNRRPVCPFSAGSETGPAKHGVPRDFPRNGAGIQLEDGSFGRWK